MARLAKISAVLAAVAMPAVAVAQDGELPPAGLLEYLGSWQDDDEEWFLDAELSAPPDTGGQREWSDDEQADDERADDEHE